MSGARCLCGAVHIDIRGDPIAVRSCWCRDCQYWASGSATVNAFFLRDAARTTGEVRWFESEADSGNCMQRGFCPVCGTPLFTGSTARPDLIGIRVGAFQERDRFAPSSVIWIGSAPKWACIDPALLRADRQPAPIE